MKKALYLLMACVMVVALAGCNVAPNIPGVTPYVSPGTYTSPGTATYGPNTGISSAPYSNYAGRGTYGTNGRGTNGNNLTGGTSNGGVKPGMPGTYGTGNNANGSKNFNNPTSKMNAMMNERGYIFINPGDKAAFPGAH